MKEGRLARWWRRLRSYIRGGRGRQVFLCDDCKWDWRSACHRPERPNAVECPDYTPRGR